MQFTVFTQSLSTTQLNRVLLRSSLFYGILKPVFWGRGHTVGGSSCFADSGKTISPQEEGNQMADKTLYESTYILATDLEEEEIEQITTQLRRTVEQAGAEFVADHLLGRRQLAYQINGHSAGIYRVMYFRGNGKAVDALKTELRMAEPIIRGIVVVANPDAIYKPGTPQEDVAEIEEPEVGQETEAALAVEKPITETSEPEAEASETFLEQPEAEATESEPESDEQGG